MKYTIAVLTVMALTAGIVSAHHAFNIAYDLSKTVTLTGPITKIDWRNPHIEVDIEVKNNAGKVESWAVEGMPPSWFKTRKVTKPDFEKSMGQSVTVVGARAKDGSLSVLMAKITLPGGVSLEVPGVQQPAPAAPAQ